ncbi:MAG: hypothetical protein LUE24_11845 [Lachnospiraceae bacterium]|nr:hypothetical protein [Lachnospiraceae bacterium]
MRDRSEEPTRVYVCSPYKPVSENPTERADELEENVSRARKACRFLTLCGYIPMCPHIYMTQFLSDDDPEERAEGMQLGLEWLSMCDELWTFGDRISEGMQAEIDFAKDNFIKVRHMAEPDELAEKLYNGLKKQLRKNESEE